MGAPGSTRPDGSKVCNTPDCYQIVDAPQLVSCLRCRERRRKYNKRSRVIKRVQRRELINNRKKQPCTDCGRKYHPVCMDFDHRDPTQKARTPRGKPWHLSKMAVKCGLNQLIAELGKCDVVCANCHRLRELKRRTSKAAA